MPVGFHLKITARIREKQLTKQIEFTLMLSIQFE